MTDKYLKKIPICRQAGVLICFFIFFFNISCFAQDYLPFRSIIQVESNISDGIYSPHKILNLAKEQGIRIVIFTESFLRRWEYGIRPLENLIKIKEEQPSAVKYGIKRYLREIDNLQSPETVVLAGLEVSPFYWWEGNPWSRKVFNFGWGRHLIVLGLNSKDYEYLPVVSKRYILPQNLKDYILITAPILLIGLGSIFLRLKIKKRILYRDLSFSFPFLPFKIFGYILIISAIIFLINNFPFSPKYDAYHGDRRYKPYQEFIDYVRKKGGFVSWAHPGLEFSQSLGRIDIFSFKYFDFLTNTFNYNAFAGIYSGDTSACFANRQWDVVLKEYCLGIRKNPVFITGEVDYDGKNPKQRIDEIQTVFFLNKLNRDSVLEALLKGRFYARRYEDNLYIDLDEFSVEKKLMGETVQIKEKPKLKIKGESSVSSLGKIKLEIIRGGEVIQTYEITKGKFDFEFTDANLEKILKKTYYRLNFFFAERLILVSNPIFCEVE